MQSLWHLFNLTPTIAHIQRILSHLTQFVNNFVYMTSHKRLTNLPVTITDIKENRSTIIEYQIPSSMLKLLISIYHLLLMIEKCNQMVGSQ